MIYATSLRSRSDRAIGNIHTAQQNVLTYQNQIASGTTVNVGSDDPVAAGISLRMQQTTARIDRFIANIDLATDQLNSIDNALQDVSDILAEAKRIAVNGANDATMDDTSRSALAAEVTALVTRLGAEANCEVGGCYLFGGTATSQAPFVIDGDDVSYRGTTSSQTVSSSGSIETAITLPGNEVFLTPVDLFATLAGLRDALAAGDSTAVETAIDAIGSASQGVYSASARVGSSGKQLSAMRGILDSVGQTIEEDRSNASETDMAEAAVYLSSANVAYEAALKVAAQISTPSLLDFL